MELSDREGMEGISRITSVDLGELSSFLRTAKTVPICNDTKAVLYDDSVH